MARPSQQLDLALLEAGEEEIRLKGVRGLSVRTVCARAGVSPRMLNYYFGSKDNFVHTLLERGYKNFSREVEDSVRGDDAPLDRLRRGLRVCLRHTIEGRKVLRNLICDAYADEPVVSALLREHNSHTRIMYHLMEEAWRRGELRRDVSPAEIFMAVMPGVFLPALRMDSLFPFNLRHIRELAGDALPDELPDGLSDAQDDGKESLARAEEQGMRTFEYLLRGFLSPEGPHEQAANAEPRATAPSSPSSPCSRATSGRSGQSGPVRPRAGRRALSVKRRFALAQPGQGKPGEKTADHPQTKRAGHVVHHAEQRGKDAE